ncbi:hypothetical protein JNB62_05250 [Microbacterium jejuense]|uniref:Uncharacterized protein n=1 Tax=Microbacterium jejuense TaxID=1263637 RepID=A0ABS7HJE4_9MICO|nr:hypothetical protein [Microbacterium jejuense]MBW9093081.1 hypothetical protein [Microbacterium jejuense]
MTETADTAAELRELVNLRRLPGVLEEAINERLLALRFGNGVRLQELGASLGKSEERGWK